MILLVTPYTPPQNIQNPMKHIVPNDELTNNDIPDITKYKERNSGSDEFPILWDDWPSHLEPPTEEDILAELDKRA